MISAFGVEHGEISKGLPKPKLTKFGPTGAELQSQAVSRMGAGAVARSKKSFALRQAREATNPLSTAAPKQPGRGRSRYSLTGQPDDL